MRLNTAKRADDLVSGQGGALVLVIALAGGIISPVSDHRHGLGNDGDRDREPFILEILKTRGAAMNGAVPKNSRPIEQSVKSALARLEFATFLEHARRMLP